VSALPPLDARVRLAAAVAAWAVALGTPGPGSAAWVAALALLVRAAKPRPLRSLAPALALGLGASLLAAAAAPAPAAAALLARILSAGWVGAALVAWLPLPELLAALAWARVPPPLLEIVAIGDRQRHALAGHAAAVLDAQRLRLGWSGGRRALRSAGALAGLSVWRAVAQAEISSDALALRGARGRLLAPLEPCSGWPNALFAAGATAALSACLLLPGLVAR
jgi:hypothetical protein